MISHGTFLRTRIRISAVPFPNASLIVISLQLFVGDNVNLVCSRSVGTGIITRRSFMNELQQYTVMPLTMLLEKEFTRGEGLYSVASSFCMVGPPAALTPPSALYQGRC
eukprot:5488305-Amphidinium_carterae.1